ncbi:MAG: hypothetical protein ABIQ30_15760 [Devosia sp.]
MDRLISLLAALVGLIALGGALLVHNSADVAEQRMATQIAELKASMSLVSPQPAAAPAATPAIGSDTGTADALAVLQSRIDALEKLTHDQATALSDARTALTSQPAPAASEMAPITEIAIAEQPVQSATPAALSSDGPTTDCIPLGTRFMAAAGDDFPICRTKAVVKVSAVSEGEVLIEGPGSVVIGSSAQLNTKGCSIAVLSADTSGYAEMRVTCI